MIGWPLNFVDLLMVYLFVQNYKYNLDKGTI
jgi:hypothetical protein